MVETQHLNFAGGHLEQFLNELFAAYQKQLPGNWTKQGDLIEAVKEIKLCLVVQIKPLVGGPSQHVLIDAPEAVVNVRPQDKQIITKGNA